MTVKRVALLLGGLLAVELGWLLWMDQQPAWRIYQQAFVELGVDLAQDESRRSWYEQQSVGIREIDLPALNRVDRCITCHLGIDDPTFRQAAEPFRTHSPILESHPSQHYGCTVCHNGNGRAVELEEAHGESAEAPMRMWRGAYLQAACFQCHGETTLSRREIGVVLLGQKAINEMRCLRCHQVNGEGESEGPDLSAVGSRRDWVEIFAHLINPQAVSPGSTMPDLPLNRSQAEAITAFLLTLQGPGRAVRDQRYRAPPTEDLVPDTVDAADDIGPPEAETEERVDPWLELRLPQLSYAGGELFDRLGCSFCHRVGRVGGEVGPALTYIGRARDEGWLRRLLEEPEGLMPSGVMPQMYLSDAQTEAIVAYLLELR